MHTLAAPNAHVPDPDRGRYEAFPVTVEPIGSQLYGSPTSDAAIWKMEFHEDFALVIDTQNIKQRFLWQTFQNAVPHLKAFEYLSISSFIGTHPTVSRMVGWTSFLKDVTSFSLDGKMSVALVKKLFPRMPKTLKKLAFLPDGCTLQMPAHEALNRVPKAVQYLT
uniref:Uncharacterized protein n=1 Tax=Panagrolaimus superbus TaxID=310955 RepID=A0A914XU61_9BILA